MGSDIVRYRGISHVPRDQSFNPGFGVISREPIDERKKNASK